MHNDKVVWQATEYEYREKSLEWFISFGVIALALFVVAILFKSFLFAVLIAIGAIAIALHANRPPPVGEYEINRSGILVGRRFYPYSFLDSFCVDRMDPARAKLLLVSKKMLMALVIIPLGDLNPDEVQRFLQHYLTEKEHHEPLSHKLFEYLGF